MSWDTSLNVVFHALMVGVLLWLPWRHRRAQRAQADGCAQRTQALSDTCVQLQATQEAQHHLMASISHALRTPMHAILGFNALLLARVQHPLAREILQHTQASADHLLTVVNDMLEHAQLETFMPKSYNGGTVKYRVHWECSGSSSGDAVFGLQGASLADNETIDVAYGTAVEITDSHNGAGKRMVTAWSGDVTFSGSPAGGEAVSLQFYRKADNAADTLDAVDVQVICVELLFTVSAANDS